MLVSTGPTIFAWAPNGGVNPMRFGTYSTDIGQVWPGVIDDASFYSFVLSPSQVTVHAAAFLNGSNATSDATAVVTGQPTAVTVAAFSATRRARTVLLRWRTAGEGGVLGFDVYRGNARDRVRLNHRLFAATTGVAGGKYSWVDRRAPSKATRYWLRVVRLDGTAFWAGSAAAAPA